jgi:hypothetical protein
VTDELAVLGLSLNTVSTVLVWLGAWLLVSVVTGPFIGAWLRDRNR